MLLKLKVMVGDTEVIKPIGNRDMNNYSEKLGLLPEGINCSDISMACGL